MMNSAVAKRYGKALLQIAQENDSVDAYQKDLELVVDTIAQDAELNAVWIGKEYGNETKIQVMKSIFGDKVSANVVNLLCVVVNKGRESSLADILAMYKVFADEARNIAYAEVISAFALTEAQEAALVKKLSEVTGKDMKLSVTVDPSVVGGLCVKYGDKVYDGTVAARLNGLKNNLLEA